VLDPTFGSGGTVATTAGASTNWWNGAAALAIYPTTDTIGNAGKIVAAGNAATGTRAGGFPDEDLEAARCCHR
jgi:hypothetical protein